MGRPGMAGKRRITRRSIPPLVSGHGEKKKGIRKKDKGVAKSC